MMDFKAITENATPLTGELSLSQQLSPKGFPPRTIATMWDVGLMGMDYSFGMFGLISSPALRIAKVFFTVLQSATEALKLRAAVFANQSYLGARSVVLSNNLGFTDTFLGAIFAATMVLCRLILFAADWACSCFSSSEGSLMPSPFTQTLSGAEA